MLLVLLGACASGPQAEDPVAWCDGEGDTLVGVVSSLVFARPTETGVSAGFDLDGRVTAAGAADGCGVADFVDPDGVPGIDNGFATLLPALELTEAAAVEGLIQASIDSGELLILFELGDLDHPTDDACVDLSIHRGVGEVSLGTDGVLESWQTFDVDAELPGARVTGVPMVGGRVDARGIDLDLPANVLGVDLLFPMRDGAMRVERRDDGGFTGVLAGGIDVAYLLEVASTNAVDPSLVEVLGALLLVSSDLDPAGDGSCDRVAMTFTFSAQPAFLFEDPPPASYDTGGSP